MRKHIGLLFLMLLIYGSAAADESRITDRDKQAVTQALQAYEEAWSRHDAHAIAGFYYEPAMRVSAGGPVVRATRAMQETFFSGLLSGL